MVSDQSFARKCTALVFEFSGKLDQSVAAAERVLPKKEFQAHRCAVGAVMAEALLQILNPIYQRHPEIKPKGFE